MSYRRLQIALSSTQLIWLAAVFLVLTCNATFFRQLMDVYPWGASNAGFLFSVAVLLGSLLALLMTLLSTLMPARIVVSVFVLVAAGISFFTDQFGTVIDTTMIQNVMETDASEAGDLLSTGLLLRLFVLGVLPVAALWRIELRQASRVRELGYSARSVIATVAVVAACLFAFSDIYAGFFRQHKTLRYYTNPSYALYSIGQMLSDTGSAGASGPPVMVAPDAHISSASHGHELIIMVVGETARRDRFSLNGYARNTNPELARESNLISYSNITSCGTSTAVAVPCMFSGLGSDKFSIKSASGSENILDVLDRVGVSVLWRDNNSSSKGVADRVVYQDFKSPEVNPVCDIECRDVGMLDGLQDYIDAQSGDILIVLHQMGNHGPAYFKRYPPEFERFTPACHSEELSDCSEAEIGNAYDNAILYTDYFLAKVITLLKTNTPRYETAMLYVSDHGESLGENGLYLHGLPKLLAPAEQTDVPVIAWIGESSDADLASSLKLKDAVNSHDAVFQSLLALFEVETDLKFASPMLLAMKGNNGGR